MSVVKKKKHVSKKNKKDWRKHCDIKDVEEFLEDQRLEERLGKFATKPDSELFVVDTAGDHDKVQVKTEHLTAKARKRALLPQTPKCYEILLPASKVEDPNKKRNKVNPIGSKPTALSKLSEKRQFEKKSLERKVELARKNRRIALDKRRKSKQIKQTFDNDLWDGKLPEAKGVPETLCDEFISTEARIHNVLPERRLRAKPPLAKMVTTRAAIELPHPGVSYNPSFQEHQDLLQKVVEHEQKMIKKEKHLHRVTTHMFSRVTQQEKENQWKQEMGNLLPSAPDSDPPSDSEYRALNPPVRNRKKDHKARRKQRERLLEKERMKRAKIDKKKITDLYKLRQLQSSIKTAESRNAANRAARLARRESRARAAPPALNANRVALKEPEFVPPESLTGDLRHISSKANLLRERFESLQHRGALAASKIMMKKQRKLKSYFKAGHKVTDQEIQKYVTPEVINSAGKLTSTANNVSNVPKKISNVTKNVEVSKNSGKATKNTGKVTKNTGKTTKTPAKVSKPAGKVSKAKKLTRTAGK